MRHNGRKTISIARSCYDGYADLPVWATAGRSQRFMALSLAASWLACRKLDTPAGRIYDRTVGTRLCRLGRMGGPVRLGIPIHMLSTGTTLVTPTSDFYAAGGMPAA